MTTSMILGHNRDEISVRELSHAIKGRLEDDFGRVRVRGEINSLAKPNSGHLYFSLIDSVDDSRIQAVCFRRAARNWNVAPEDGQEVIVTARLTAYSARSQYQLIVEQIEFAGIGAWLKMLEERRHRLEKEGLFDRSRKKSLPLLPRRLGVITSEKGAVWQDIIHRVRDRFPLPIVLCPVLVQGRGAPEQIVAALATLNALPPSQRPEVIIVARGGGSMEDLMTFQEESVVRAVAASAIPVVSGVGHETDTTLIDHAADLRASTPTAAAELVVPVRRELLEGLVRLTARLNNRLTTRLENRRLHLARFEQTFAHPGRLLERPRQNLDLAGLSLTRAMQQQCHRAHQHVQQMVLRLISPREILRRQRDALRHHQDRLHRAIKQQHCHQHEKLQALRRLLGSTSLTRTLERGFALVTDEQDRLVTSSEGARAAKQLTIRFSDGTYSLSSKNSS